MKEYLKINDHFKFILPLPKGPYNEDYFLIGRWIKKSEYEKPYVNFDYLKFYHYHVAPISWKKNNNDGSPVEQIEVLDALAPTGLLDQNWLVSEIKITPPSDDFRDPWPEVYNVTASTFFEEKEYKLTFTQNKSEQKQKEYHGILTEWIELIK